MSKTARRPHVAKPMPADRALSRVRVARATLVAVRECLTDAVAAADRGINRLEAAHAEISAALQDAGVPFTPTQPLTARKTPTAGPGKRMGRRARGKKAPAKSTGARGAVAVER